MGKLTHPKRGTASTAIRAVACKECLREAHQAELGDDAATQFEYNEQWAASLVDRGDNRSDRCVRHRKLHRDRIQSLAVAYIDLETIGEVADRKNPTGPLGGLGELPKRHIETRIEVNLERFQFGMGDDDVRDMLRLLANPQKRVLILKAGTGTGKSTFAPFRLMSPPSDVLFRLTDFGPIIVTEPRVQATTGVATFVGERLAMDCPLMQCSIHGPFNPTGLENTHEAIATDDCVTTSCTRHIGPGYPVGYQVGGATPADGDKRKTSDKRHDDACQLIYVTDGTMINWLRDGRLNRIGAIIVDEVHERSTNIDFILGYLRTAIDMYPHLRVIVTSATFDVDFFVSFFGGEAKANKLEIPAVKTFGYGSPLFPRLHDSDPFDCGCEEAIRSRHSTITDFETWLSAHWPEENRYAPTRGGESEDLWEMTRKLYALRSDKLLQVESWRPKGGRGGMPEVLAQQLIRLTKALDDLNISGDILGFLPSSTMIDTAVGLVQESVSAQTVDVYGLIQSAERNVKEAALAARPPGARRKIVIATNLAETSLTVEGVRFVVDSGLTTQGEWNVAAAFKTVPTKPHSQAGIRQRWGRVGRDFPGWVFPLYSRAQFDALIAETPPGSTRDNLEQFVLKATASGIDDIETFVWPAQHEVAGASIDDRVRVSMDTFKAELKRAKAALTASGALDAEHHDLTELGKELERFGNYSTSFALATIYADQLACVPEVLTALLMLDGQKAQGADRVDLRYLRRFEADWPAEWRLQASRCHAAMAVGCADDLDQVLRIVSAWERADETIKPWEPSMARTAWADQWWIDEDIVLAMAQARRDVLTALSPAMKDEVKRFVDVQLTPRARAVITRAFGALTYERNANGSYSSASVGTADSAAKVPADYPLSVELAKMIPLARAEQRGGDKKTQLLNLVEVVSWANDPALSATDLMLQAARECPRAEDPGGSVDRVGDLMSTWPVGSRHLLELGKDDWRWHVVGRGPSIPPFFFRREHGTDTTIEQSEGDNLEGSADTSWPTGISELLPDEDQLSRYALIELDEDQRDPSTGREMGLETNDAAEVPAKKLVNMLTSASLPDASSGEQVLRVLVDGSLSKSGWYEVTGYKGSAGGEAALTVEAAWRGPESVGDPTQHPDLVDGADVDVVFGRLLSIVDRPAQELIRADQRGRFLLERVAKTKGPSSAVDVLFREVPRGTQLTAMVVPAEHDGTSISFLPAISHHLTLASTPSGVRRDVGERARRSRARIVAAKVTRTVDPKGVAQLELAIRDSSIGILHKFAFQIKQLPSGSEILTDTWMTVQLTSVGSGLRTDLVELDAFLGANSQAFYVDVRDGQRQLISRGVLAPVLRDRLIGLQEDDRAWRLLVWSFFLRSHQWRVSSVISLAVDGRLEEARFASSRLPDRAQELPAGDDPDSTMDADSESELALWTAGFEADRLSNTPGFWEARFREQDWNEAHWQARVLQAQVDALRSNRVREVAWQRYLTRAWEEASTFEVDVPSQTDNVDDTFGEKQQMVDSREESAGSAVATIDHAVGQGETPDRVWQPPAPSTHLGGVGEGLSEGRVRDIVAELLGGRPSTTELEGRIKDLEEANAYLEHQVGQLVKQTRDYSEVDLEQRVLGRVDNLMSELLSEIDARLEELEESCDRWLADIEDRVAQVEVDFETKFAGDATEAWYITLSQPLLGAAWELMVGVNLAVVDAALF